MKKVLLIFCILFLLVVSVASEPVTRLDDTTISERLLDRPFVKLSGDLGSTNGTYGEMWNYTSAGWIFDIDTAGIYYNLTGFVAGELNGFEFVDRTQADGGDGLNATVDGLYILSLSLSFSSQAVGGLYGISLHHDFNPETHRDCYARREANTATGNVGVTCIMSIMEGETVRIMIENENNARDMTIYTANLNARRILLGQNESNINHNDLQNLDFEVAEHTGNLPMGGYNITNIDTTTYDSDGNFSITNDNNCAKIVMVGSFTINGGAGC